MFEDTAIPLPWSNGRRVFLLVMHLAVIVIDLVDRVVRARRWAPWLRLVGLVVIVIVLVRGVPLHLVR